MQRFVTLKYLIFKKFILNILKRIIIIPKAKYGQDKEPLKVNIKHKSNILMMNNNRVFSLVFFLIKYSLSRIIYKTAGKKNKNSFVGVLAYIKREGR